MLNSLRIDILQGGMDAKCDNSIDFFPGRKKVHSLAKEMKHKGMCMSLLGSNNYFPQNSAVIDWGCLQRWTATHCISPSNSMRKSFWNPKQLANSQRKLTSGTYEQNRWLWWPLRIVLKYKIQKKKKRNCFFRRVLQGPALRNVV